MQDKKRMITLMNKKKLIYLIFLIISILFSISFSIPANAAVGDLILDTRILYSYPDPHEATTLGTTLLKKGYSISLDDVYDICCQDRTAVGLTIYKNEDIIKTIKVNTGDYIYYNKTIGGSEYTIIESKFDAHFLGVAKLKPSKKIKNEAGFEIFLALSILLAVYSIRGRKNE